MIVIEEIINRIMPFLVLPFVLATMRVILHMIFNIMNGNYEPITKEIKSEEKAKREIDIDKDLKKYFNYKE